MKKNKEDEYVIEYEEPAETPVSDADQGEEEVMLEAAKVTVLGYRMEIVYESIEPNKARLLWFKVEDVAGMLKVPAEELELCCRAQDKLFGVEMMGDFYIPLKVAAIFLEEHKKHFSKEKFEQLRLLQMWGLGFCSALYLETL